MQLALITFANNVTNFASQLGIITLLTGGLASLLSCDVKVSKKSKRAFIHCIIVTIIYLFTGEKQWSGVSSLTDLLASLSVFILVIALVTAHARYAFSSSPRLVGVWVTHALTTTFPPTR